MYRITVLLLTLILLLTGCASHNDEYATCDIYAMDTLISISLPADNENAESVLNLAQSRISQLESILSATVEDSTLSRFNASDDGITTDDETLNLMKYALEIADRTDGAYDPTCLGLTQLWRVNDGGYVPTADEVTEVLATVDHTAVNIEGNVITKSSADITVDFGGIAKGYTLGKVVQMMAQDIPYGMVSFGGNVGVWGQKKDGSPWQIGIKDPYDTTRTVGMITLPDMGGYVSVSGDYERYFEADGVRYHHIFDPDTGYPADNGIHSVAVYTNDAAIGDALSTALFVMGYEDAMKFYDKEVYDFEALFVTDDGIVMTEGMEAMFVQ